MELATQQLQADRVTTLDDADPVRIPATLLRTNGVVGGRNGAAARLGLKSTTLIARMRKLGLSPPPSPRVTSDSNL